jgi:hypothetical protein
LNGVTYYYVAAAQNQAGGSANSDPVGAMPASAGALPANWSNADLGAVGQTGSARFAAVSGNTFIAKGADGNIGDRTDACNFTHRALTGDWVLTARLLNAQWTGREKVGLMIRESLASDAKAVALTVGELGDRQCRFGTRAETSARMTWQSGNDYTWLPTWFKIQRTGNIFTGYQFVDGTNWFKVGETTVTMPNECRIGLAVTSGKREAFNTAIFDHVIVQSAAK